MRIVHLTPMRREEQVPHQCLEGLRRGRDGGAHFGKRCRDVLQIDGESPRQEQHFADYVFELAHVPGPGLALKKL